MELRCTGADHHAARKVRILTGGNKDEGFLILKRDNCRVTDGWR